jgi:hypothetical protein
MLLICALAHRSLRFHILSIPSATFPSGQTIHVALCLYLRADSVFARTLIITQNKYILIRKRVLTDNLFQVIMAVNGLGGGEYNETVIYNYTYCISNAYRIAFSGV